MAVKIYRSIAADQGSSDNYKTALAQIQEKADELNAGCTINSREQTITVISDHTTYIEQAVLDFNGNIVSNGALNKNGEPTYNSKVRPFNSIFDGFKKLQEEIRKTFGPYILIKIGLNGDVKLLKELTESLSENEKRALFRDIKAIGELVESSRIRKNIEKCEAVLLPDVVDKNIDSPTFELPEK
jgi:hypothetical protein